MIFNKKITLKNGQEVLLRNGDIDDGQEVYDVFNVCHKESDYLLSYPEENSYTPELGFNEYGRNPKGFNSKLSGYQELVYMYLEL